MLISPIFADQSNLLIPLQSKIIQFSELANQSTLNLIIAMYIFGITQISVGKKWGQVHFSGLSQLLTIHHNYSWSQCHHVMWKAHYDTFVKLMEVTFHPREIHYHHFYRCSHDRVLNIHNLTICVQRRKQPHCSDSI